MKRKVLKCDPAKGRTRQSCKDECDINKIMARYHKNGVLPKMILENPIFGDFSSMPDYQESMGIVIKAQSQFNALSAELRNRFGNDPAKFLDFCSKEENRDEMKKLGLLKPEKKVEKEKPKEEPKKSDDTEKNK